MATQSPLLEDIDRLLEAINKQGLVYVAWRFIEAFGGLVVGFIVGYLLRAYFVDVLSLSGIAADVASVVFVIILPWGAFALIVRWQQRRMDGLRALNEYGKLIQELHVVRKEVVDGGLSRQGALKSINGILVEHRAYIAVADIPIPTTLLPNLGGKE